MLLDSNLIIYASKPGYDDLRDWMSHHPICASALSQLEVLGYHRLIEKDRRFFMTFFSALPVLPITSEVIEQAIALRQQRKMTLGDATIAATAIINNLAIATHNSSDFEWIPNLVVIDPISSMKD
ncbi:MAG: type II toxin-antitoxin system VapC family toxin [Synechococcales bacterium]|nr:type II toxin-antitoxin system VapC family toxin [Synechococcales bacterium]